MKKRNKTEEDITGKPRKILIGRLIDGTGIPARQNILMSIEKGRIANMRPFRLDEIPPGDSWMDLSGHTVLPPLFDCHVHLSFSDALKRNTTTAPGKSFDDSPRGRVHRHILDHLRHGVLGVRDAGDITGAVLQWKPTSSDFPEHLFRLHAAGPAWYREGRYGKLMGKPVSLHGDAAGEILGEETAGIDHVKLIQSGLNSLIHYGKQSTAQFQETEIQRIYELAKERGIGLMIHANGEAPVAAAISGGCDSIEHGYFMGDENLRKMAAAQITWVPTAVPMKALAELMLPGSTEADVARRSLEDQILQISRARQYGVPVALGTDAGSPGVFHGKSVAYELKLFMTAGYTVEEAVSCATMNAARMLKTDLPGCLAVGTPATFIAVNGEGENFLETGEVEMVMVEGVEIRVPKVR